MLWPWVQHHRYETRRKEIDQPRRTHSWHKYLNCDECLAPPETRRMWGCGFLCESQRAGVFPRETPWPEMESPICPGYLISLPKVREAAHARGWAKTGQLALRMDNVAVTPNLMDAIDWIDAEESAVEIWVMRDKSGKG